MKRATTLTVTSTLQTKLTMAVIIILMQLMILQMMTTTMTCLLLLAALAPPVAHGGKGAEEGEESAGENHSVVLILHLVAEGHGDEGDASDEVADVEEEETSEEAEAGAEEPGGLLARPQAPEGGAQVPHALHASITVSGSDHLLLFTLCSPRWPPVPPVLG